MNTSKPEIQNTQPNPSAGVQPSEPQEYASDNHTDERPADEQIHTPRSLQEKGYLFIQEIGHGGQAKIFQAIRESDRKIVVIKQLNIGSVKTWKEYDLFQREAKVLASLKVPGVARFYEAIDCVEDDPPSSYIVQEFIEGDSLARFLQSGHRFKVTEIYDILIQMLRILAKLHSMTPPVIHRDIKPSNIMITPTSKGSYEVTLIDFGAVANPQVQSGGSTVAGTFGYMPPEQLMGHPEPASDIYALAMVAIELFSGKSPATLPTKDLIPIFEPYLEHMPPALLTILRQMIAQNPKERLKDSQELIQTFEQFKIDNYTLKEIAKEDIDRNHWLNEAIRKVQSIGESGNLEIWQKLPDAIPRAIPNIIYTHYENMLKAKRESVAKEKNKAHLDSVQFVLKKILFITIVVILGLGMATVLLLINFGFKTVFISIILIIIVIFSIVSILSDKPSSKKINNFLNELSSLSQAVEKVNFLIQYGRKTIATIVDVQHVQLKDENICFTDPFYICGNPSFKIIYKFNPPDDAKEEDLFHECIVHSVTEILFKQGDPLPILYSVSKNKFLPSVTSMPFPFPLQKNVSPSEFIHSNYQTQYTKDSHDDMVIPATPNRISVELLGPSWINWDGMSPPKANQSYHR